MYKFFICFYKFSTEELRLATGASAPVARKNQYAPQTRIGVRGWGGGGRREGGRRRGRRPEERGERREKGGQGGEGGGGEDGMRGEEEQKGEERKGEERRGEQNHHFPYVLNASALQTYNFFVF